MNEFSKSFKEHYVRRLQTEDFSAKTWFGCHYSIKKGMPKWQTMCRSSVIASQYEFLQSFDDNLLSLFGEKLNLAETHVGIDSQLGYQVLQWSVEQGIASGCIEGSSFEDLDNPLILGKSLPHVRTGLIGEPGAKYRTITIAPAWLTILLTPLGHDLITMLQDDSYCRSGLKKEKQGWRFASDMFNSNFELDDSHLILKGDLQTASDMMSHQLTRSVLTAYLQGRNLLTPFYKICIELLTCGRYVECPRNFSNEEFLSTSGVFMGDPGCKGALTLTVLVARTLTRAIMEHNSPVKSLKLAVNNFRAYNESTSKNYFGRSAGDDFCELGSLAYLQTLCLTLEATGCIVGTKWLCRNFTTYCEEGLLIRCPGVDMSLTRSQNTWQRFYSVNYKQSCYVDTLKLRLFSPCGKVSQGVTGQIENPSMGKGILFRNMLDNLPSYFEGFKPLFRRRWVFRMCNYINISEVMTFLDRRMGGLGLPYHRSYLHLAENFFKSKWINNENYLRVMTSYKSSDYAWVKRIISKLHKGCLSRGFSTSLSDEAWAVYKLLAQRKLQLHKLEEIPDLVDTDEFRESWAKCRRFRDKLDLANRHGYLAEGDAQQLIEKGWVLKQGLINPSGLFNPKNRHRSKYSTMESELRNFDPTLIAMLPQVEDLAAIRIKLCEYISGDTDYPYIETLMINKDALLANFSGLLTPIPARVLNLAYCSGQIE
jgi:hypothetical protein